VLIIVALRRLRCTHGLCSILDTLNFEALSRDLLCPFPVVIAIRRASTSK